MQECLLFSSHSALRRWNEHDEICWVHHANQYNTVWLSDVNLDSIHWQNEQNWNKLSFLPVLRAGFTALCPSVWCSISITAKILYWDRANLVWLSIISVLLSPLLIPNSRMQSGMTDVNTPSQVHDYTIVWVFFFFFFMFLKSMKWRSSHFMPKPLFLI